MDVKIIQNNKAVLEIEVEDGILPSILADKLISKGVDAYSYEPHPLLPGFRLHIESSNAMTKLKGAITDTEKDFKNFSTLLKKEI